MWAAGSQGEHLPFLRHSQGISVLEGVRQQLQLGGVGCKASLQEQTSLPSILKEVRCWGDQKPQQALLLSAEQGARGV